MKIHKKKHGNLLCYISPKEQGEREMELIKKTS